jgi:hypothetical protein
MNLLLHFILILTFSTFASADGRSEKEDAVWDRPLKSEYHNLNYPYETVIRVVECLPFYVEAADSTAENISNACIKTILDRKVLVGNEDPDRNSYYRLLIEGPPKEGPFTHVRVIRVGNTKSLLQIESVKWNVIFGNSGVRALAEERFEEIKNKLKE